MRISDWSSDVCSSDLSSQVMACEQGIFPLKGNGPDRPLDGVIIELDPSIVEEADEAFPVVEGVPNGLGRVGASGQLGQHLLEPRQHICEDRKSTRLNSSH